MNMTYNEAKEVAELIKDELARGKTIISVDQLESIMYIIWETVLEME